MRPICTVTGQPELDHPPADIGGSASVLPDLPRSLSVMLSIDRTDARRRLGRGVTDPEVAAGPWCPSIMRANVPAADGQILPDQTHAVCGKTVRSDTPDRYAHPPGRVGADLPPRLNGR